MTNLIKPIFLYLALFLLFSCKKDKTFPPATDTGAGHFAWIANGAQRILNPGYFNTYGSGGTPYGYELTYNTPPSVGIPPPPGFYLHAGFVSPSDTVSELFELSADSLTLTTGQTYTIGNAGTPGNISALYEIDVTGLDAHRKQTIYNTANNAGQLVISNYDTKKGIISGTFYFDAYDSKGDRMAITSGRFDFVY